MISSRDSPLLSGEVRTASPARSLWFVVLVASVGLMVHHDAEASQIGIGGSRFEELLTKEPISTRTRVAGFLGVLLKAPVHEEITQLAYDCTVAEALAGDKGCAAQDVPFASPFIIAGVRWNDLPPFRLAPGQGAQCKKFLTMSAACNVEQTVRFSTQPECWYCLFKDASVTAQSKAIAGCNATPGQARGNLMTRSHFGDLQFLHAMANSDGVDPRITQKKILDWIEFAWRVATEEYGGSMRLTDVPNDTIKEHFGCTAWTVADLYVLGRNDTAMLKNLDKLAFGSVLHTVQDSFSASHVSRGEPSTDRVCIPGLEFPHPGLVEEFHGYAKQDGGLHDVADERVAVLKRTVPGGETPLAVAASRQLRDYVEDRRKWAEVVPFFTCLFELSPTARNSSAGAFSKR